MSRTKFFLYLLLLLTLTFLTNYFFFLSKKKSEAQENAKKIESILSEYFGYTEKILVFIGSKISNNDNYNNLPAIYKIFTDAAYSQGYNDVFSWTMFDWVNRQDQQTVNTLTGVNTKNPADMSKRGYTWKGRAEFWTLQFSSPTIGNPSDMHVIPVGVGVPNKNNSYVGNIAVGISIKKLTNKIEPFLSKGNRFSIVNYSDYSYIFGSHNPDSIYELKNLSQYSKYAKNRSKKHDFPSSDFLDDNLEIGNNEYVYSRAMDAKYPYIILTGYNKHEFWREVISSSLLFFMQATVASIIVLLIVHRFQKSRFDENF